ncbi:MAG TPA: HEAT repeat domain-containing protein [Planctomycetaceae bacterium]|jgi:hypothetical protein|nr:HEAT repeat domain-containing protein [Planctomycetaceae bacterium]
MSSCKSTALCGAALALAFFVPSVGSSDEVTLQNGGIVRGKVARSGTTLAVTSPKGIRIVVDRSDVRKIAHETTAVAANKGRLTPAQKEWLTKIRKLVARAQSEDRDVAARAVRDLRAIHDPDAMPALMQVLRTSDGEARRLLYVRILGDMPGAVAGPGLAEEALFDDSSVVRDAAADISKRQKPEFIRAYYGQALRFPNREVVVRAASVLESVGNMDDVPYLIDSLYSRTVDIEYRATCCVSRANYLAAPYGTAYSPDSLLARSADRIMPAHIDHVVPVYVVRKSENPQVKNALEAITKKSFGYNTAAWRRWWRSRQLAENDTSGR